MKRNIIFILLISNFVFFANAIYSQTTISGVINSYSAVDSIYPTNDTLLVSNPNDFNAGDTIMIYQMKGAVLRTDTSNNEHVFGYVFSGQIRNTGKYEIVIIQAKNGNEIILRNDLINSYNTNHLVQIIRVPSYKNVVVENEVTCDAWDGEKGGVLVLMVNDTLFLNADLNVDGKGFRGAQPVLGSGDCASTDSLLYRSIYFNELFPGAGEKGEGIGFRIDSMSRGFGAWGNGGGGGNGRFAGGGGGGNSNVGGAGGGEDTLACETPLYVGEITSTSDTLNEYWKGIGGRGGSRLSNFSNDSTVFLGGGGGSGTMTSEYSAIRGGNGGGVIVIIAKVVKSNGQSINANGETPQASEASAGGGGGGGTIVFDADSVNGDLNLFINGGDGGNVLSGYDSGPGGGGGGGMLLTGKIKITDFIFENLGGLPGAYEEFLPNTTKTNGAEGGNPGFLIDSIKVPLNGFLFNSIAAKEEVCSGDRITIYGSNPRGGYGDGTYTYQWEQSADGINWSVIPGETKIDYQTPELTDTIYYKRIVTSGDIIDPGIILKINVQTVIVGNTIVGDDLITCIGNPADTLFGSRVLVGGNSQYEYIWEFSLDKSSWENISTHDDTICFPGTIQDTTFIRRVVISGACYDTVSLGDSIIGLPQITNNIVQEEQEICNNDVPNLITGNLPENGLGVGSYFYLWQEKTNSTDWTDIPGATNKDYQPGALNDTTYYRRIVFSDDCIDESDSVMISVLPNIVNNVIENVLPVFTCYNTNPDELLGSLPDGGNGSFNYQWQDSISGGAWQNANGDSISQNYNSGVLTDTTFFRRVVTSSACIDYSDPAKVKIWDLPVASIASIEDTICSEQDVILEFSFTDIGKFPMNLTYNNGVNDFVETINTAGIYNTTVNPVTAEHDSTYLYTIVNIVDDNGCIATSKDGLTTIEVFGNPVSYAGDYTEECSNEYELQATESLGTGVWKQLSGPGIVSFTPENSINALASADVSGKYTLQWKETNWRCSDSAQVEIYYYLPLDSVIAGKDTVLNYETEFQLEGFTYDPDEELLLDVILDLKWEEITNLLELVDKVQTGEKYDLNSLSSYYGSKLKCVYTVTKGVCDPVSDTVLITINDIFVPESIGFTPNGDGDHEHLKFDGLERAESNELIIFNRWGTEVYRKVNFSNEPGWDGKNMNGNDLPDDTYYWILHHTKKNGVKETNRGFVVIKR